MILLDSDICLSILYGKLEADNIIFIHESEIAVTSITVGELFYAANRSSDPIKNKILVEKFLLTIRILHTDISIMKYIADLQLILTRKGKKQIYADIVTYCMAKSYEARLVTRNGKRYCFT